jgi:hypothetical protein
MGRRESSALPLLAELKELKTTSELASSLLHFNRKKGECQ